MKKEKGICRMRNIRKLKDGFVRCEVIDMGGNVAVWKRKCSIEELKEIFNNYVERIQGKTRSVDQTLVEGRHRLAQ